MAIKSIDLSGLFIQIYSDAQHIHDNGIIFLPTCEICQERLANLEKQYRTIVLKLESAKASDFSFMDYDLEQSNPTMADFESANRYTYDKQTLFSIYHAMISCAYKPKSLLVKLVGAGFSAKQREAESPSVMYSVMATETNEEICWYILYLGLEPCDLCYRQYGCRRDKTVEEKIGMFKLLWRERIHPNAGAIITWCFSFSDDLEEVKEFINWFVGKGYPSSSLDLINSFTHYGTKLFDFLVECGSRLDDDDLELIVFSDSDRSIEDKLEALEFIHKKWPNLKMREFPQVVKYQSLGLIKSLLRFNMRIEDLVDRLLLNSHDNDTLELTFDFVTECMTFILENTNFEVPYKGSKYHDRSRYRFEGKLYDWMLDQKKMIDSMIKRKELETQYKTEEDIFIKTHGMSRGQLKALQEAAKVNGQCYFYSLRKSHSACRNWPNCRYYHGNKADCYKIHFCSKSGESCDPRRCTNRHPLPVSLKKEFENLQKMAFDRVRIPFDQEETIAKRLREMPWLCYIPINGLDKQKRAKRNNTAIILQHASCSGKIFSQADDGEIKTCGKWTLKFMARNEDEIWPRYYCSLEHLRQVEGTSCNWYLVEPGS